MLGIKDLQHVTISVSDIDRSIAFYRDLLRLPAVGRLNSHNDLGQVIDFFDVGHGALVELVSFSAPTKPSEWVPNDLQAGLRHIGFKVREVDAEVARLKAAGVEFTMEPTNAVGGVRIAFFKDPDGTLLELVQGELQHHKAGTAAPVVNEQPSEDRPLVFDHVAISVTNLDATLRYYRDLLGFPVLGQLFFNDARGFVITNVLAGTSVLEFFSFSSPMTTRRCAPDETMLGLKHLGFAVDDTDTVASRLNAAGAQCANPPETALGDVRTAFFQDPDGNALELIGGTRVYDQ